MGRESGCQQTSSAHDNGTTTPRLVIKYPTLGTTKMEVQLELLLRFSFVTSKIKPSQCLPPLAFIAHRKQPMLVKSPPPHNDYND